MNVVWLPLAQEYRDKYDEEKAYEFFKTIEGEIRKLIYSIYNKF